MLSFILILTGCVIDDDFGKADLTENKGTLVLFNRYVNNMFWFEENKVLLHESGLNVLDVTTKQVSLVTPANVVDVLGVTQNKKAIFTTQDNLTYQFSLWSVTLETNDWVLISENVFIDYYFYKAEVLVSGNLVAYNEVLDQGLQTKRAYVYNTQTGQKKFVSDNSLPLAFSPDNTKLLYMQSAYFLFDIENNTHAEFQLPNRPRARLVWNSSGMISFGQLTSSDDGFKMDIWKESSAEPPLSVTGIQDYQSVMISRDGAKVTYPGVKCANPYYVNDCFGQPAMVSMQLVDINTRQEKEIARFTSDQDEFGTFSYRPGDFSPDGTQVIYSKDAQIYIQSVNP